MPQGRGRRRGDGACVGGGGGARRIGSRPWGYQSRSREARTWSPLDGAG
jgi:hypothetical protein